jgi:tripartite-type tricarboxylate transporter receptor subunit TctC
MTRSTPIAHAAHRSPQPARCRWPPHSRRAAHTRRPSPARPIRIIVPCAAGGASDILARTLAELVAVARGKPGVLNCSAVGAGSAPHLAGALFVRLQAGFSKALWAPEVVQRMTAQGAGPRPMASAEFGAFLRDDPFKCVQLVKDAGIRAE